MHRVGVTHGNRNRRPPAPPASLARVGPSSPSSVPRASRVSAVPAGRGRESAALGGLLYSSRRSGASLSLLCLTRGEPADGNSGAARLEAARPWEVQTA